MNRRCRWRGKTMRPWRPRAQMWQMPKASWVWRGGALSYALVFSPIDGYVAERTADLGEYVSPTTKVATVVRINPLRIRIDIPEQAIPAVTVGQSVSVTTSAWPDKNFSGRIARISPNVTPTSRTLTVEAEIENSSGVLKPGQFATVRILQSRAAAGGAGSGARRAH